MAGLVWGPVLEVESLDLETMQETRMSHCQGRWFNN